MLTKTGGQMSSLYKSRDTWYISINHEGKRYRKSLGTKDHKLAQSLKKKVERQILRKPPEKKYQNISFRLLCDKFINSNHDFLDSTKELYKWKLKSFLKNGLPENLGHRNMVIRTVNRVINWGLENGFKTPQDKLKNISYKSIRRTRIYTDDELDIILNKIVDSDFQRFIRFIYYTGVRIGEACSLDSIDIRNGVITGKTGDRQIKITAQALAVLQDQGSLWNYTVDSSQRRWKRNMKRLGIKDARIHDLRRTFGYNLIKKKGLGIFQVSKLLGHSNVATTQNHYAPLLPHDVPDFEL